MRIFVYFILALTLTFTIFLAFKTQAAEESKSAKRLNVTQKYLKSLDSYRDLKSEKALKLLETATTRLTKAVEAGRRCLVEPDADLREACKDVLASDYSYAKQVYRLIKYYAIAEGKTVICVKADLGVGQVLLAKGFNSTIAAREATLGANPKETGRTKPLQVFLCADSKGQRKLRVQDGSGTWLPLSPEDKIRPELQINNLPGDERVSELETKVGLK
ncbi:MAG: hypothetical protein ACD_30C00023G0005 [uncultured bacterium]|uniref:Uncharacterized protein n=3 Tax=Candidatus Daviesiibacteriota TaxID=1752718 RepID=A0A0G0HCK6_9BACT|nr:MAG: hypothetical protein ACD_30C00023G0005 [uncultured bacterium]KKQ09839.1 MAG: hypothetical protein US19_C0010G0017 [Candidatus Daviesbacteria bacterium GW2011_GWB1_36_5]KKQ16014.1 MAG: hypothetical protein US28_C0006G0009 [Candidatus Daviesbacteria bacterium GW2011_GWA1_36_8]OGE31503.1 MAG: hypothetical protein A3C99_03145 [Candidatus Daviesbacteria bacterium RIFCSPHIGHO2_02_FULL_37_9]OGE36349.1 MAG: hypothetical protein A3E66_05640 [Candidatus Daviesbacteria bacterium RIFCSPHIGHO2_12_FU